MSSPNNNINNNNTNNDTKDQSSNKATSSSTTATTSGGGGIVSRIHDFMDQQRLERLKQCQEIDVVVKRCLQRRSQLLNKNNNNNEKDNLVQELDINQTIPGTRMMRYFGWHQETSPVDSTTTTTTTSSLFASSILQSSSSESNEKNSTLTTVQSKQMSKDKMSSSRPDMPTKDSIPTCAKETHALWACRSVCLGCSPHLQNLKDCFQLIPEDVLLNTTQYAYEPTTSSYTTTTGMMIPCRELQQELGKCVVQQAKELQQRLNQSNDNNSK